MTRIYFWKKTLRLLVSLWLFSIVLYGLLYLSTGDPALGVLRKLGVHSVSQEVLESTRIKLGIDGNFWQQYFRWFVRIIHGDFGYSFMTSESVLPLIFEKVKVTLIILIPSSLVCMLISLGLGLFLGNYKRNFFAKLIYKGINILLSFPIYWIAILVIFLLGVKLNFFPFVGSSSVKHFVLPILVCCLSEGSYLSKMVADLVTNLAEGDREILAKFRGLRWYYAFFYQIRNLFIPLISLYANSLIHFFGGMVMVEIIFSIAGLGKLLMDAISMRDYPVIQGITLIVACSTFLINYLTDLFIEKTDERVNINRRK